jgi:hypothetical protein
MKPFAWFETTVPSVGIPKSPVSHLPFLFSSWKHATAYVPAGIGSKAHVDAAFAIEHHRLWSAAVGSVGNPLAELYTVQPTCPLFECRWVTRMVRTAVGIVSAPDAEVARSAAAVTMVRSAVFKFGTCRAVVRVRVDSLVVIVITSEPSDGYTIETVS